MCKKEIEKCMHTFHINLWIPTDRVHIVDRRLTGEKVLSGYMILSDVMIFTGQVIVYESGNPVLKVESGTTLKVIKLLYEAEHDKKGQILGVRPKQFAEGIPCIVTLDESKLNESSYDILVSDDSQEKSRPPSPVANELTISRCIECSRESWKTKRFTNVGMNTEISVNPTTELDVGKISTNHNQQVAISGQPLVEKVHSKNGAPSPSTASTRSLIYESMPPADYMVALQPTIHSGPPAMHSGPPVIHSGPSAMHSGPNNGKSHMEEHEIKHAPSPTYSADLYRGLKSPHMRYAVPPTVEQIHYEHFIPSQSWSIEHSRHGHDRSPHREHASRSPPHRNRSPFGSSDMREGYSPYYHEKHYPVHSVSHHRSHREERSNKHHEHREDSLTVYKKRDAVIPRTEYVRELPAGFGEFHQVQKPKSLQPQPADEPPVFVLPSDFDAVGGIDPQLAVNGMDPQLPGIQERRSTTKCSSPPNCVDEREKDEEDSAGQAPCVVVKKEYQTSPNNSTSSFSPKSVNECDNSPDPSNNNNSNNNNTQKLLCKICNSVFPTKSLLYKHLRGHTSDEKPFKCNECGQGFTLSSNLRQHRIIHRGYKPFQCEFCGKKFMRSNVYKQHRRVHTGEEMHKCGLCPSEFLQKYALVKHMIKNHDIDTIDGGLTM